MCRPSSCYCWGSCWHIRAWSISIDASCPVEGESDLTLPGRQLLDPRPPPHDEGGMASVMNIYPPAARMGIPPRYSLTGGEGETPAKARGRGRTRARGALIIDTVARDRRLPYARVGRGRARSHPRILISLRDSNRGNGCIFCMFFCTVHLPNAITRSTCPTTQHGPPAQRRNTVHLPNDVTRPTPPTT